MTAPTPRDALIDARIERIASKAGGAPCTYRFKTDCPNMLPREGDTSMTREHYDCKVCGKHESLDYEEML